MHIKAIQHEQCNYVLWMCWSLSIAVCLKCIETDVSLCSDHVPGVCGPMCICSGEEDPHGDFSCKLVDAGRCGGRCVPSAGTWWLGWCAVDYWDWTVTVALCLCLLNQYVSLAASTEAIIVYVITILSCFQWLVNVVHYFCTFVKCVFCHWTQRYFSH